MAENLFRTLGTVHGGNGSSQAAANALRGFVRQTGLSSHYVQVDGSGLSPLDEVSAGQVVDLLRYAHTQSWFKTFEHSLIHIGRTNQCSFMCGLMDHTPADGRVWLKTGNLGNQWNYAGYARAKNGDLIAFAILMNGLRTDRYFQQASGPDDAMTVAVASWPRLPAMRSAPHAVSPTPPEPLAALLPKGVSVHDVVSGEVVNVRTGQVAVSYNSHLRLAPGLLPRLPALFTYLASRGRIPLGSGPAPALPASLPWEDFPRAGGTSAAVTWPNAKSRMAIKSPHNVDPAISAPALGWQTARRFAVDLAAMGVHIDSLRRTPVTAVAAVQMGALPPVSARRIVQIALTQTSAQLPLALSRGISSALPANAISQGPLGAADLLPDLSGLGLENYMTAASVARLLLAARNRPLGEPLAQTLGADRLWVSTTPEQWAAAGYITAVGQTYAVSLLINGLPWNGSFSPTVGWDSAPAHWRP